MKFTIAILAAMSGLAAAQVNEASATAALINALPASILSVAITNQAAASSIISSELAGSTIPAWFLNLPSDIQTYFITSALGPSAGSSVANSIASEQTTTPTDSSRSVQATATSTTSNAGGVASFPTGLIGGGVVGAAALVGALVL